MSTTRRDWLAARLSEGALIDELADEARDAGYWEHPTKPSPSRSTIFAWLRADGVRRQAKPIPVDQLAAWVEQGRSAWDIAKSLGVHEKTVSRQIILAGLAEPTDETPAVVAAWRGDGDTVRACAERLGRTTSYVREHLARAGVETRGPGQYERPPTDRKPDKQAPRRP
ncbi:hypothetical protein [Candidatus Neomicrothrix sp.]|uniref:hypothetical protein n=1 Tax=Candidatus Neomicrothrix sp. TaxID=2719034 RepID=UPI001B43D02C|nr:hypothetical protein [Candidatus Microthrix sp.]MBP7988830.1 hypothetical protein [Candidatus Microthrix sp.]